MATWCTAGRVLSTFYGFYSAVMTLGDTKAVFQGSW